jgi:hypothetical protein
VSASVWRICKLSRPLLASNLPSELRPLLPLPITHDKEVQCDRLVVGLASTIIRIKYEVCAGGIGALADFIPPGGISRYDACISVNPIR